LLVAMEYHDNMVETTDQAFDAVTREVLKEELTSFATGTLRGEMQEQLLSFAQEFLLKDSSQRSKDQSVGNPIGSSEIISAQITKDSGNSGCRNSGNAESRRTSWDREQPKSGSLASQPCMQQGSLLPGETPQEEECGSFGVDDNEAMVRPVWSSSCSQSSSRRGSVHTDLSPCSSRRFSGYTDHSRVFSEEDGLSQPTSLMDETPAFSLDSHSSLFLQKKRATVFAAHSSVDSKATPTSVLPQVSEITDGFTRPGTQSDDKQSFIAGGVSVHAIAAGLNHWATQAVENSRFDFFFGIVIMLNACSMGVQTEYMARTSSELVPLPLQLCDTIFCLVFLAELLTRLTAYGVAFFWRSGWQWNWFDSVLVVMQLFEEIVGAVARLRAEEASSSGGNFSALRVLRVLRLVRLVRLARVLRFVRQLRTLVMSIAVSLQSLGWTVMLIVLMIYVVGIYLTQLTSTHRKEADRGDLSASPETLQKMDFYFGTLGRSILTLFEAITGGVDWDELAHPLSSEISPLVAFFFACYIAFAVLAMMNVVTGVFVESALQGSTQDKESQIMETLENLFIEFDMDDTGKIHEAEFLHMISNPNTAQQFKALDVTTHQAKSLFHLIDVDRSGVIDIEAFIMSCLRLRGNARAADMTTLIYELKRFMAKWQSHAVNLESALSKLQKDFSSEDFASGGQSQELLEQVRAPSSPRRASISVSGLGLTEFEQRVLNGWRSSDRRG
jgi:voltage-gated sodium channel